MEKAVISTVEELKQLEMDAPPITELVVANLTENLKNDEVKIAQAAMYIKTIIRRQTTLEKISLQNNNFPPPELQFIIKALIDKHKDTSATRLIEINFDHAVTPQNLERSGRELRHLQKIYGDHITFDDEVYTYFIQRFATACQDYLEYMATEVIIPKGGKTADASTNKIELADRIIQATDIKKDKENSKFKDAITKYLLVRELYKTLQTPAPPLNTLKAFHNQYKKIKKNLPPSRNQKEATHEQHFHAQVGDLKSESFNFPAKQPHSIFKTLHKKKTLRRKKRAKPKKAALTQVNSV